MAEINQVKNDAALAVNSLDEWTRPDHVGRNMFLMPRDTTYIIREPYGVVLVLGAWNFPINLTLLPVVGALAAGNALIIKPSEISLHTEAAFKKWLPEYLDQVFPSFLLLPIFSPHIFHIFCTQALTILVSCVFGPIFSLPPLVICQFSLNLARPETKY